MDLFGPHVQDYLSFCVGLEMDADFSLSETQTSKDPYGALENLESYPQSHTALPGWHATLGAAPQKELGTTRHQRGLQLQEASLMTPCHPSHASKLVKSLSLALGETGQRAPQENGRGFSDPALPSMSYILELEKGD